MNEARRKATLSCRRRRYKKLLKIGLTAAAALLIAVFAFLYSKYRLINKAEVNEEKVTNPYIDATVKEVMKGYKTFAIFGQR